MATFPVSPPWRFFVTKRDGTGLTFLDRLASNRVLSFVLNQPANLTFDVPSESPEVNILTAGRPFVANNDRLIYGMRRDHADVNMGTGVGNPWFCRFGGIIMQVADHADEQRSVSTVTAFDSWQLLFARPVVDNNGDPPSADKGLEFTNKDAKTIALNLLWNTVNHHGPVYLDAGLAVGGGSPNGFGDMGTGIHAGPYETTQTLDHVAFQRGATVGDAWAQLAKTGTVDIVITPIWDINRPGYIGDLGIYAQVGSTQSSAVMAWDEPSHSLFNLDRLIDGGQMANKILFFGGMGTANPVSAPITIGGTTYNPGDLIPATNPQLQFSGEAGTTPWGAIEDAASVNQYGQYWYTQAFPGQIPTPAVFTFAVAQAELRSQGKTTVAFKPTPERSPDPWNEYWLGDFVPIYASDRFRDRIS